MDVKLERSSAVPLDLRPPRRQTLVERVAEQLMEEIDRQQLPPGARLPSEREIVQRLGVGRSTVREALNGLALVGVIEIHHGKGVFVADALKDHQAPREIGAALARSLTQELLEARKPVESEIVRLAARRRTKSDLAELEDTLVTHEQLLSEKRSAAKYGALFHRQLADAAHNQVLASFVNSIQRQLVERGNRLEQLPGYREWELAEHKEIFEAVRSGDPDRAAARLQQHLAAMQQHHDQLTPATSG
jgi:GntR family transcriptional regulator, transcriptional repressor for pyruvate dehydrogenase complex